MSESHGNLIAGQWRPGGGDGFCATNPATGQAYWQGHASTAEDVDRAIRAARLGLAAWSGLTQDARAQAITRFRDAMERRREEAARLISDETGKPRWEAATEVGAILGKVSLTFDAFEQRRAEQSFPMGEAQAALRYKPHGVLTVLGPFNLPGHLPNGHIVPALLAGNTIVFKPSEQTPAIGQLMAECWDQAGLPDGVFNLVQGARETGVALAQHPGHDGILFTGSYQAGAALHRALIDTPHKVLALEMGGNNPLIVHEPQDLDGACYTTIQSAYITAGQRCTDARRLILVEGAETQPFLDRLVEMIGRVRWGVPADEPQPFFGPLINTAAADAMLRAQDGLLEQGGVPLVEMRRSDRCDALVSPGLIDVSSVTDRRDDEYFGPLLQVVRVPSFSAAIEEANNTSYGLSASLLSGRRDLYETFYAGIRAGIVNWNKPTSGASGRLPFGGIGKSGNHRPSGFFAPDYCGFPVASVEQADLTVPENVSLGLESLLGG